MIYLGKEYLKARFEEIRDYVSSRINAIDEMEFYEQKMLCLFSLLEIFVQEEYDYPTSRQRINFCNFVLKYSEKFPFLKEVDPITLFYDFEEELEGEFNLDYLEEANIYAPQTVVDVGNSNEIIEFIKAKSSVDSEFRINKHTYVNLIYTMRCKLSHEGFLNSISKLLSKSRDKLPSFISQGTWGSDEIDWVLGFPYDFIKELTFECIENFLISREKEELDPFKNNNHTRKHYLAWND